jgi:YYY domain-containing protein
MLNLAVPTLAALAAMMAFGILYNLTNRKLYGLLAIFLVMLSGNYYILFQFAEDSFDMEKIANKINEKWDYYYWSSTRALFNTHQAITEFPFFTFMWGDFHPHTRGIMFQLLVISMLLVFVKSRKLDAPYAFLVSVSLGFLLANNSWDFPFYAFLSFLVIFLVFLNPKDKTREKAWIRMQIIKSLFLASLPAIFALLLYAPYILSLDTRAISGIGVTKYHSPLLTFLSIYILPIFVASSFLAIAARMKWNRLRKFSDVILASAAIFGAAFALVVPHIPVTVSFILPLLFSIIIIGAASATLKKDSHTIFALCILLAAFMVVIFSETFYIKDYLQNGDHERMNTVFKFYLQAWVLFGIASAYGIFYALNNLTGLRKAWTAVLMVSIAAASIYPPLAVNSWTKGFSSQPTLDGLAYMSTTTISVEGKRIMLKGDMEAIRWVNNNIKGSQAILEAVPLGAPYGQAFDHTYFSRVSALTGLPTVVGWVFALYSWGYQTDVTEPRIKHVNEIYSTLNASRALELLNMYNVSYVFVGSLENLQYPKDGLEKFDSLGQRIYDDREVRIFKVIAK